MLKIRSKLAVAFTGLLLIGGCTSTSSSVNSSSSSAIVPAPSATSSSGTATGPGGTAGSTKSTVPTKSGTVDTSQPGGLPSGVKPQTLPTSVANSVDKRKSVAITSCASVPGGWGAKGTAANKTSKAVTYAITIFFTTSQATTIASAVTKVTVKPGGTVNWQASGKFKAADTMLCVLRGVG